MIKFYAREYKVHEGQWAYAPLAGITTREDAIEIAKGWGRDSWRLNEVRMWPDGTIEARCWAGGDVWNNTYPSVYDIDRQREEEEIIKQVYGDDDEEEHLTPEEALKELLEMDW